MLFKRELRLKKQKQEKGGRCVGQDFNRTTIENPQEAIEELHHNENVSSALQHSSIRI